MLQHEFAHVKRLDACTQLVAGAASALFWFHPLVWHATRHMRHERERACDDCVLAHGAVASAYAADLLALVQTCGHVEQHQAALAMARCSQFEGRLLALLDPSIERAATSLRHLALVLTLALLLVVPIAALRGVETKALAIPMPAALPTSAAIDRAAVTPPALSAPLVVHRQSARNGEAPDLFANCAARGSSHDHSSPVNGHAQWIASAQDGECRYELIAHGDVTFNDSFTAIDRISEGGDFDVSVDIRGDVTHLLARPSSDGGIVVEFSRNGTSANFTATAHAWFAQFLVTLDRHTAFAIDRRLPRLLQAGGSARVLDEIDLMHTDHARAMYLVRLASAETIDTEVLRRVFDRSGRLKADHDKLDVLLAVARSQSLSGTTHNDYLNAASTLQEASARRRALAAIDHR